MPAVVHAMRRVPLSLPDDIKNELDDMEAQGIIAKIKEGEPTAWVVNGLLPIVWYIAEIVLETENLPRPHEPE